MSEEFSGQQAVPAQVGSATPAMAAAFRDALGRALGQVANAAALQPTGDARLDPVIDQVNAIKSAPSFGAQIDSLQAFFATDASLPVVQQKLDAMLAKGVPVAALTTALGSPDRMALLVPTGQTRSIVVIILAILGFACLLIPGCIAIAGGVIALAGLIAIEAATMIDERVAEGIINCGAEAQTLSNSTTITGWGRVECSAAVSDIYIDVRLAKNGVVIFENATTCFNTPVCTLTASTGNESSQDAYTTTVLGLPGGVSNRAVIATTPPNIAVNP